MRLVPILTMLWMTILPVAWGVEQVTVCSVDRYLQNTCPSIGRLADGRLLCVFCSSDKKTDNKMVVMACFSNDHGRTWGEPTKLINTKGDNDYDPNIVVIGSRVIVSSTTTPPGSAITTSRTIAVRSEDNGKTWSKPYDIPMGHRYTSGKVNNGIVLRDGAALFGYTWEAQLDRIERLDAEGQMIERSAVMISFDRGGTWTSGGNAMDDSLKIADRKGAIAGICEPAVIECSDGSLYMLARTGLERLYECRSTDGGRSWSKPVASALTGHNAPAALCRIEGKKPGILVAWDNSPKNRWPLCVAASFDDATTWTPPRQISTVDGVECSYPGCIQAADGTLVVVWVQSIPKSGCEIRAARFSPEWVCSSQPAASDSRPSGQLATQAVHANEGRIVSASDFMIKEGLTLTRGRGSHAGGVVNGKLIIVGGSAWTDDGKTKLWLKDSSVLKNGRWIAGPSLPQPVAQAMYGYDAEGLYLAGGTDGSNRSTKVFHLSNTASSGRWQELAPLPRSLSSGAGVCVSGRFYVACGETDAGMSNQMWCLDLSRPRATWKPCAPLPGPGRAFPALAACGRSLYLLGGVGSWDPIKPLADSYRYDPAADMWKRLADLPWPGYAWSAVALSDRQLLLAGRADGDIYKDIWIVDVDYMSVCKGGDAIIQTTTAPLIAMPGPQWWLLGGEPDSNKHRTDKVTVIQLRR